MWGVLMPKKGVTGHDGWVVTEALATALVALEQLPPKHQPQAHMEDIRKLLANGREPAAVSLHLAQAKCRLFLISTGSRSTGNMASAATNTARQCPIYSRAAQNPVEIE